MRSAGIGTGRRAHVFTAGASVGLVLLALTGCAHVATGGAAVTKTGSAATGVPSAPAPHDASAPGPLSGSDGRGVAEDAMRAFCRPDLSRATWIAGLDPYLTLAAAAAYGTVDPARVPCRRITGSSTPGEGDGFTELVKVPTDAGVYRVTLSRGTTAAAWQVFRMTAVETPR